MCIRDSICLCSFRGDYSCFYCLGTAKLFLVTWDRAVVHTNGAFERFKHCVAVELTSTGPGEGGRTRPGLTIYDAAYAHPLTRKRYPDAFAKYMHKN